MPEPIIGDVAAGGLTPRARRALTVGGVVLAVCALVAAGVGIASARGSGESFRIASAEIGDVVETVDVSGTVASASRADLAFQTDGTVASVEVGLGDVVAAGDVLATLDEVELQEAIDEAAQAVADAEQTLADHKDAQASASSTETVNAAAVAEAGATNAVTNSGSLVIVTAAHVQPASSDQVDAAIAAITQAQDAMLAKNAEVTGLIAQRDSVSASVDAACQPLIQAVIDGAADDGGAAALSDAQVALAECQGVIDQVTGLQDQVTSGQDAVAELAAALDAAVSDLQSALAESDDGDSGAGEEPGTEEPGTGEPGTEEPGAENPGTGDTDGEGPGDSQTPGDTNPPSDGGDLPSDGATGAVPESSGGASPGGSSGGAALEGSGTGAVGGTTITAEQLLADQAAIDLANANLAIATAQRENSSLTSPISGTVASVAITAGESVSAGSDTAVITVIGDDGFIAETTVSLSSIAKLQVGQSVEATIAATGERYEGAVSSIGVLNVSTTSTPAYTVTVSLSTAESQLLNGGSARLGIQTAAVEGALTVPTSAVHVSGSSVTVNVPEDGESVPREVEVGAVGAERTEILSGIEEGQDVILADLNAAIDSDSETSGSLTELGGTTDGPPTGGGGFGGGGMPGGGAPTF